jgi:hypothetical protein
MTGPWRFDIAMLMMWVLGVDNVYVSDADAARAEGKDIIVIDSLKSVDAHETGNGGFAVDVELNLKRI